MGRVLQLTSFHPPTAKESKKAFAAFFKRKNIPSLKFGIRMSRKISAKKFKMVKQLEQSELETNEW